MVLASQSQLVGVRRWTAGAIPPRVLADGRGPTHPRPVCGCWLRVQWEGWLVRLGNLDATATSRRGPCVGVRDRAVDLTGTSSSPERAAGGACVVTVRGWRSLGWDADGRLARAIMSTCDEFSKKKKMSTCDERTTWTSWSTSIFANHCCSVANRERATGHDSLLSFPFPRVDSAPVRPCSVQKHFRKSTR